MSYETDQLLHTAKLLFSQSENRTSLIESRMLLLEGYIHTLQSFVARTEPFIKAMELIDPPENKTP